MNDSPLTSAQLLELIYLAIDDFNASAPAERHVVKAADTALFSAGAHLDSLELVHLIVALEQQVLDRTGRAVALADERAFSQKRSPFRDVGALLEHLAERLGGAAT